MPKKTVHESLLPGLTCASEKALPDLFVMIARNIENGLIQGGAVPGKDYTRLDLFKLAQPFVLHRFQKGDIGFQIEWPDDKD